MSAAQHGQLIVLGAVMGTEVLRAFRMLRPAAPGLPRHGPERRLGWRIGVLARLAADVGLVAAVGWGVGWATIVLCVGIARWALTPARLVVQDFRRRTGPNGNAFDHVVAIAGGGVAFLFVAGLPIAILQGAHPDVSRAWLLTWVGLGVGVSLAGRRMNFLRLQLPDVWPDETLDVLEACVNRLLASPIGSVLSVSHKGGRRILGFERVKPFGGEPYAVEFILWNDARPYEQLSRAIEALSSVSVIRESGALVPEGYPTQSCRVNVAGSSETIRARAHALAEAAWRGFELTESARVRYTLTRDAQMDLVTWKATAQAAS